MMKNTFLAFIVILVFGQLCHFGMPWWVLAPIAAIVMWIFPQRRLGGFVAGFVAGALLWGVTAYWHDAANGSVFSTKIGQLFQGLTPTKLIMTTGLLGGLLGGLSGLTGQWARDLFQKPAPKDYYRRRRRGGRYR